MPILSLANQVTIKVVMPVLNLARIRITKKSKNMPKKVSIHYSIAVLETSVVSVLSDIMARLWMVRMVLLKQNQI